MIKPHPAIVDFPVVLLSMAALFAVISLFKKNDFVKRAAFWNLFLGVIGAIAAVLTGLIEEQNLIHNEEIHQILVKHKFNGFAIMILSQILLTWYWVRKNKFGRKEYILWVSLLVIAPVMIIYQGFLGGRMVYDEGAGVKPMELQLEKEGESPGSHHHSDAQGGHEHNNHQDTSSSKKIQSVSGHEHNKGQDTTSSKKAAPEKKKELKDMKY